MSVNCPAKGRIAAVWTNLWTINYLTLLHQKYRIVLAKTIQDHAVSQD